MDMDISAYIAQDNPTAARQTVDRIRDAVAHLADLIPGARLARVSPAGHSVYFERPAAFNAIVDDFLSAEC